MATEVFITAVGADRPGVVAGITGALAGIDANLADTSMTTLGGRFAMVLLVAVPDGSSVADVEAALVEPAAQLALDVHVHPADSAPHRGADRAEDGRWVLSIHGADHPGIVHGITRVLAELAVNVEDMRTRVIGSLERPVYAMILDVESPRSLSEDELRGRLTEAAGALGVELSLNRVDTDIL